MNRSELFNLVLLIICSNLFMGAIQDTETVVKSGVGLGSVLAVVISWDRNRSILWAAIHGMLSWLYVIYYAIIRNNE